MYYRRLASMCMNVASRYDLLRIIPFVAAEVFAILFALLFRHLSISFIVYRFIRVSEYHFVQLWPFPLVGVTLYSCFGRCYSNSPTNWPLKNFFAKQSFGLACLAPSRVFYMHRGGLVWFFSEYSIHLPDRFVGGFCVCV